MENLANLAPSGNTRTASQKKQNELNALRAKYKTNSKTMNRANIQRMGHRMRGLQNEISRLKRNETRKSLRNKGVLDYIIVKSSNSDSFQTDVMTKLGEGYVLQGGVSVGSGEGSSVYHQAMVKTNQPPKNLLANNVNLLSL